MPLISFQVRTKCIDITSSDKLWYSPVDHSIPSPYSAGSSLSSHQWFFYFCSVLWGFIRVIHSRMQILVNEEEKERDRRKIRPGESVSFQGRCGIWFQPELLSIDPQRETNLPLEKISAESDFFLSLFFTFSFSLLFF